MRYSVFSRLAVWGVGLSISPAAVAAGIDRGPWSGAVTDSSATVNVKMTAANSDSQLVVSTQPDLSNPVYIDPKITHQSSQIASFDVQGLQANTTYYYGVRSEGVLYGAPSQTGQFRTFPVAGTAATFTFSLGSCSVTGSNHPVFNLIRSRQPLFHLNAGDLHYSNIATNDPALFRSAYDSVLGAANQSALYRSTPIAYVWDDHDFGPNDSDRTAPGRAASRQVYQEYVPHYTLAAGSGNVPIDQAFTVGQARFVLSDLRSERDPRWWTDDSAKHMMNDSQLAWFKGQVLQAKQQQQIVFWVSSVPWIGAPAAGADHWAGYHSQRQEIAAFLAEHQIDNLVILSGDAHMLAADDGTNSRYSADPDAAPIPVLHGAALQQNGSTKGGPYSHGAFPNPSDEYGQFALVTVTDLDGTFNVQFAGYRVFSDGTETQPISMSFSVAVPEPGGAALGLIVAVGLLRRRRRMC